ncbi:uncharacterized protein MEPE_04091 [Melanopsichium pennsylvanicum]|uniref:Sugar phosphate transporter domain-containing protein n=1 Tax=Melanopsichium pennsylvanicum TaxID=63383 RepID=A0AAJ5C630_9BASI|nr:uncharacterized protein MEPE_04091 [Melanopsichium pennsylvanicum]
MACTGFGFNADDLVGFSAALASTLIFVAQNIYSKKLLRKGENQSTNQGLDQINILFYSSACSIILMIPMVLYYDANWTAWKVSTITHDDDDDDDGRTSLLIWLLFVNGLVHFCQNILAFNVLSMVSPVTYSIASLLKRIFVIVLAIIWFGESVTILQWFGIGFTFYGLYMYNHSKTKEDVEKGEKKAKKKQDGAQIHSILPISYQQNNVKQIWNSRLPN